MAKPSLGVSSPSRFFTPASDQSTVSNLKVTVQFATPKPDGRLQLTVFCGNVAFGVVIDDLPGRPEYKLGDRLLLEYPKGQNPMTAPYSAIYHADQVSQPQPQPKKVSAPMNAIATVTMTSLEMVDYINSERKAKAEKEGAAFPSKGYAQLEHSDFLKKVPEVLGEHAGNFSCMFDVAIGNGAVRKSPGYNFPKRAACLMAMSYSYELQAKVFDKMTALEQRLLANSAKELPQRKVRASIQTDKREAVSCLLMIRRDMAKVKGINPNLLTAYTLDAIEQVTGLPVRNVARALPSVAPEDTATLKPTKVGEPLGMSPRAVNAMLEKIGFQYRDENKDWKLTEAGTAYGETKPFHNNGHSGYEILWKPSVIEVLRNNIESSKEAA